MKVVSTEALTKLIQLVKSAFVKVEDVVETSEVTLADVALSGDYDDLINKPTIPTATSDLTNDSGFITSSALSGYATETWVGQQGYITDITSSDVTTALGYTPYNSTNPNGYITSSALTPYALSADLASVATSGSYNDLSNKPTIPTVNNATLTITQGGVSKGTFTANASSDVTIALDSGGSSLTAGTGIDITNDVISVEGVKDQRNTSTAIKTWTGTKAQYDAIATKDSATLYNITDDTDVSLTVLEALYPIGAIYIGIMEVCPLQVLGVGSWVKVSEGRVLQGADSSHNAGITIEAGLPNIIGETGIVGGGSSGFWTSSAGNSVLFGTQQRTSGFFQNTGSESVYHAISIDASRSSSIYGNSTTVQPSAFVVNIWQRTA